MKVSTMTYATGTYATFTDAGCETSVLLPNGTDCVALDLRRLADEEDVRAAASTKRAQRLRRAAQSYASQHSSKRAVNQALVDAAHEAKALNEPV